MAVVVDEQPTTYQRPVLKPATSTRARPTWVEQELEDEVDPNQPVSQSPGGFGWSTVRNVTETQAGHSGG